MFLEIVSPEAVLFSSEVDSVVVPGISGEFQMLNNHAPIVSLLNKGTIKIYISAPQNLDLEELHEKIVLQKERSSNKILTVAINSGTLEMKDNKAIILAD